MTVVTLPDTERLLWAFIRDQAEVTDLVAPERVLGEMPTEFNFGPAFVRFRRIGGAPLSQSWQPGPMVTDRARIQWDVYAGPKSATKLLGETIRAVLGERLVGAHASGVVSRVEFGAMTYLPDSSLATSGGGPRPRYIFDTIITTKPARPPAP